MTVPNPGADAHGPYSCQHRTYGMDCAEFEALRARAAGQCELCGTPEETAGGKLVIDHDHKYGPRAVRGLVCQLCNLTLVSVDHRKPQTDRWTVQDEDGRRRLKTYLEGAWFMQLAGWARATDHLFGIPDVPGQDFRAVAMRQSAIHHMKARLGVDPALELRTLTQGGQLHRLLSATFATADGYVVVVQLRAQAGYGYSREASSYGYGMHQVLASGPNLPDARFRSGTDAYRAIAQARKAVLR